MSERMPGRKFSTRTSAVSKRRDSMFLSSLSYRFSTTDFLFRLNWAKYQLSPLTMAPCWRTGSPRGPSILITSAPRSARSWVQKGPARIRVRSITRRPLSGTEIHWGWSALCGRNRSHGVQVETGSGFHDLPGQIVPYDCFYLCGDSHQRL